MEQGIFAPSATTFTPFLIRIDADSSSISFCVAHGRAISQGTDHIFVQSSKYSASGCVLIYSLIRAPSENLIRLIVCKLRPFLSYTYPFESLHATTFAPNLIAFSIAYIATFPEPDVINEIGRHTSELQSRGHLV